MGRFLLKDQHTNVHKREYLPENFYVNNPLNIITLLFLFLLCVSFFSAWRGRKSPGPTPKQKKCEKGGNGCRVSGLWGATNNNANVSGIPEYSEWVEWSNPGDGNFHQNNYLLPPTINKSSQAWIFMSLAASLCWDDSHYFWVNVFNETRPLLYYWSNQNSSN